MRQTKEQAHPVPRKWRTLVVVLAQGSDEPAAALARKDSAAMNDSGENEERNVAVFLYPGVELLDFGGPGEVFAATPGFNVYTVAATPVPIPAAWVPHVRLSPRYPLLKIEPSY